MSSSQAPRVERWVDQGGKDYLGEALAGLLAERKRLPAKLLYDEMGSRLFQHITELREYYPTRTEIELLRRMGPVLGELLPPGLAVVEYGAGSERKAEILLGSLRSPRAYIGIDIAAGVLEASIVRLKLRFPSLIIQAMVADFVNPTGLPSQIRDLARLGFFPGSTIGNMDPSEATAFLGRTRRLLGTTSWFLVGVDLRKDPAILVPAYDDGEGITAAFNRNMLVRLNREGDANFDPEAFTHVALWNDVESRIEMHLVSRRPQIVSFLGHQIRFLAGESIHTENSYKHTVDGFRALAKAGGWEPRELWTDPDDLFSVHLLQAGVSHGQPGQTDSGHARAPT